MDSPFLLNWVTKRARALTPKGNMPEEKVEATEKDNASETTESESEQDNSEKEKEVETESEGEIKEEVSKDYLGEDQEETDWKKRYGDSTREFQTLKTETETMSKAMAALEKLAKVNPSIIAEIEKARQLETGAGQDSTLIQQQIDKALEPVKKVAQDFENKERLSKAKVLSAFEKYTPDLFSPKATAEEKKVIRQRIGKVANALVESGMDFKKAVSRAYLTINPKAAVKQGKDEAYAESFAEDQAGFSSQSSDESKKTKPRYSQKELEVADKLDPSGKVKKSMLEEK